MKEEKDACECKSTMTVVFIFFLVILLASLYTFGVLHERNKNYNNVKALMAGTHSINYQGGIYDALDIIEDGTLDKSHELENWGTTPCKKIIKIVAVKE